MKIDTKAIIERTIEIHRTNIKHINDGIWSHPEPAWKEKTAHDLVCDYFESLGPDYKVTRHAYNIETSFLIQATYIPPIAFSSSEASCLNPPTIAFNAEYDALAKILVEGSSPPEYKPGHACGHNLICSASVAAFIATWEALRAWNFPGTVKLIGTPAEEGGGGKIKLLRAGAYIGVDACLMAHPGPPFSDPNVVSVAFTRSTASQKVIAEFVGVSAHAGMAPWLGRNALDACITSYTNVSALRQQLHPSTRVAGIITHGGTAANIIPDYARAEYTIRATKKKDLEDLCKKIVKCFQAGADAMGCTVKADDKRLAYWDIISNEVLCNQFTDWMNAFSLKTVYHLPEISDDPGPASDQGNVSYSVPAMQAAFQIMSESVNHTPGFMKAAGTEVAFNRALNVAKGLAGAGLNVLTNATIRKAVKDAYDRDITEKAQAHIRDYSTELPSRDRIAQMLESSIPHLRPTYEAGVVSTHEAIGALMAADAFSL
ncbi:hypothetical protein TWF970_005845 [Orbilia oligospora]|uniref:Peptidase M20 dimerisation domain-containing protein n=1 Tax=Orbilia oligospora TaxID=2813651 RepID=A0A7C8RJJ9_ORBOL|nr:hypothetical protein TWF970_005845 [Orbilia oligospora]